MSNPNNAPQSVSVSLDEVYNELTTWRANKSKHKQPNIPDDLWRKILVLVDQLDMPKVKALLGVSTDQIRHKQAQLNAPTEPALKEITPTPVVKQPKAEQAAKFYQPAPLPSKQTFVVELHHESGKLMKIHSTTDTLRELMCAFYGEDEPCFS